MSKQLINLTLLWLVLGPVAIAAELKVGDTFPELQLEDQHDEAIAIAADARTILFAVERQASDLANGYLEKQPPQFLAINRAYFITDISSMPRMITRMFALPKMRKRPYSILLAENGETLSFMPRQENQLTVLRLQNGVVEEVSFLSREAELDKVFSPPG